MHFLVEVKIRVKIYKHGVVHQITQESSFLFDINKVDTNKY
jgi:hypothetical protein